MVALFALLAAAGCRERVRHVKKGGDTTSAERVDTGLVVDRAKDSMSAVKRAEDSASVVKGAKDSLSAVRRANDSVMGDTGVNRAMGSNGIMGRGLEVYLKRYEAILESGDWKSLRTRGRGYRLGDSAGVVSKIKRRLAALGDMAAGDTGRVVDDSLVLAVRRFEHRMGMKEDGVIGRGVVAQLDVPIEKRIDQIRVNMERSRRLPDTVRGDYMVINIPEFKLHMYRDDSLLWDMKVVVGKEMHKTVSFKGTLRYIVFSPYWNVPPEIFKREIQPGMRRSKNYLEAHHMEWKGGHVRQKPGPWNAVGGIKFLFPNQYDIYLHDTPAKDLFHEKERAFSHGCIRLAEPAKLAAYLLRDDKGWDSVKIAQAMKSGKERWVTLKGNFRVYITYFTAWVGPRGYLNFRKDIYDKDKGVKVR